MPSPGGQATTHRGQAPQNGRTSMRTSQGTTLPIHPTKRHPLTGAPIQAIYVDSRGRARWPIMGGSPDGEGDGGDAGAGDAGDAGAGAAGAGDAGAAGDGADKVAADAADAAAKAADAAKAGDKGKVEDLPTWAQKLIKDTRGEAAENRTKATSAETQQAKLLEGIATALGLKKGDDTPTPEELARQLADERTTGNATAVELAVFKAAATAGADPVALTDSRAFMTKVTALDPAAKDFATKVKAEIETAVKDNPKLKATQAAGSSSADHGAGGSGEQGKRAPKSLTDAVSGHYGA